jgi:hypothetical protein
MQAYMGEKQGRKAQAANLEGGVSIHLFNLKHYNK